MAICIMAGDFDRQDERRGPLDIFIMALYRVDKFRGWLGWWGEGEWGGRKRRSVQCV